MLQLSNAKVKKKRCLMLHRGRFLCSDLWARILLSNKSLSVGTQWGWWKKQCENLSTGLLGCGVALRLCGWPRNTATADGNC